MKKIIAIILAAAAFMFVGATAATANPYNPNRPLWTCRPIIGHPLPWQCTSSHPPVIPRDPGTGQAIRHHFHVYRTPVIRVEHATHNVKHRRVVDVDEVDSRGTGRYLVWFNNGSAFYMRGCVYEDGHRCVWNAHKRGNGIGHSFVQLHRHWYYY